MPDKLATVDREQARMLVLAVGYNQASAQTGIKPGTLRQWAARFNWFDPKTHAQSVTSVTSPADALARIGENTKTALARAGERAALHYQDQPGPAIAKDSANYKNIVTAAAQLHGWDQRFAGAQFSLNVLNIGSCGIEINEKRDA